MKKKVRGFIKYHSCIIFPILMFAIIWPINRKTNFTSIANNKASTLVSACVTFIGVLITILTIYLAVPKNDYIQKRLKETKHEHIYLSNILVGIIIFLVSTIIWIFCDDSAITSQLFLAGITNILISIYYTFEIIKSGSK